MKTEKAEAIRIMYDMIETAEPEISTGRLLSQTANAINEAEGWNIDVSDVCTALEKTKEVHPEEPLM